MKKPGIFSTFLMLPAMAAGCLAIGNALAADGPIGAEDGQVTLPYAEQKFRGDVGTTYLNAAPAEFPAAVSAPEGAPTDKSPPQPPRPPKQSRTPAQRRAQCH